MTDEALQWRAMSATDLDGVEMIARIAFPNHFEDRSRFAERLSIHPQGCFVLGDHGAVAGYLITYPWIAGSAPPLNSLIHAIPQRADVIYLHDLALHPEVRGRRLTEAIINRLVDQVCRDGWPRIALVAVNDTVCFWKRHGFAPARELQQSRTLASYGDEAVYMIRSL